MAADKKALLRDALKQVQAGKLEKAVETYKAVIKVDPRDASVHNSLGDLYLKLGKKRDAVAAYLEAAGLFEKDGFALRSIAICQKVVNLEPDQWSVRLKLADLYAVQKLPAEARTIYLQVADYHDKKGEVSAALEIFRKIANLDPDNLPVRVKLAGRFEKQKQPDKAAEEYVRAANGYAARKEHDSAVQLFVRAFKLSPSNIEARRRLADYYAQRQDWPVVVGLLETPVAKGVRDEAVLLLFAEALTRVNHAREAVSVLEKAQEREPNSVPLNLALGRAYVRSGDAEKGFAALNKCVASHLADNRLEHAEALLREMAETIPDDDRVYQRMLEVAQKRGDATSISATYLKIATAYEKKGLVRNAVGALEKYLESKPGDAVVARRLEALRAQARPPKAEAPAEAAAAPPPQAAPPPVAAPPAPQAPPKTVKPPPPPPPVEEEVIEVDLEGEDLAAVMEVAEQEGLELELDEGAAAEPIGEPASIAEARACIARGAPEVAAAFLEEHLGGNPNDVEAWEALVAARRTLGSPPAVRDALLRLADVHRRAARFDEARSAFKGALDVDPRSAAAARGLAALILDEESAAAPTPEPKAPAPPPAARTPAAVPSLEPQPATAPASPPAASSAEEEEIHLDVLDEEVEEQTEVPEAAPPPAPAEVFLEEAGVALVASVAPEPAAAAPAAAEEFGEILLEEALVEPHDSEGGRIGSGPPAAELAAPAFGGFEDLLETFEGPAPEPTVAEPELRATSEEQTAPPESLDGFDEAFIAEDVAEPPAPPPPAVNIEPETPLAEKIAIPETGTGTGEIDEFLAEASFYLQQGLLDEAEFLYTKLGRLSPGNAEIAAQMAKVARLRAAAPKPPPPVESEKPAVLEELTLSDIDGLNARFDVARGATEAPAAAVTGFSDFLGDLRQELEAESAPLAPPEQQEPEGLAEIFQEFQRSVKEQLGDEDFETHYNLGIAYKEMGLMDEAIGEFALAEKSPVRQMNAVSMIALCLREMGRVDESVQKLRSGIALAAEGSEDQKGFLYDLADLHEQAGRTDTAHETLQRLLALDPGYRDVARRVGHQPAPAASASKKSKVSYI